MRFDNLTTAFPPNVIRLIGFCDRCPSTCGSGRLCWLINQHRSGRAENCRTHRRLVCHENFTDYYITDTWFPVGWEGWRPPLSFGTPTDLPRTEVVLADTVFGIFLQLHARPVVEPRISTGLEDADFSLCWKRYFADISSRDSSGCFIREVGVPRARNVILAPARNASDAEGARTRLVQQTTSLEPDKSTIDALDGTVVTITAR